jgi:hypothetical protein
MRPLELLLVLVNLLTFAVLAVPRLHAVRWMGYVAFIAVLIAIAQMIVEGPRWQMVPAYVLTTGAVLAGLAVAKAPHHAGGQTSQPTCRRLRHRAGHAGAGDLCCPADREPRVSLPASKRAIRVP